MLPIWTEHSYTVIDGVDRLSWDAGRENEGMKNFRISDECYAVENAVEELKAIATGVIGSNEQDGVAKWLLEHFDRNGETYPN